MGRAGGSAGQQPSANATSQVFYSYAHGNGDEH